MHMRKYEKRPHRRSLFVRLLPLLILILTYIWMWPVIAELIALAPPRPTGVFTLHFYGCMAPLGVIGLLFGVK